MSKVVYTQDQLRELADAIAYHYVNQTQFQSKPRVFVYNNELHFDVNSPTFGTSEILFNNFDEYDIIFDNDDLDDVLINIDVDVDNLQASYDEIANAVEIRLEQILNDYNE